MAVYLKNIMLKLLQLYNQIRISLNTYSYYIAGETSSGELKIQNGRKMKKLVQGILILLLVTGLPFSSSAGKPILLKTAAQESFPKYFRTGDRVMAGVCVDIIQAIEKVDPTIRFSGYQQFLPFKRLQRYLEQGKLAVFFGMKKTDKREKSLIFLDIPLYKVNYVAAVRTHSGPVISSFDDIRALADKGKILTVFGTAASRFLQQQGGLLVDDTARTPMIAVKKLLAGRGTIVFYHDLGLKNIIENENLSNEITILPTSFLSYWHYVAFSRKTPAAQIKRVRDALEKLEESGQAERIYSKYGLVN